MKDEPAFPGAVVELRIDEEREKIYPVKSMGLTKREYLIMKIFSARLANEHLAGKPEGWSASFITKRSIQAADALLAELEKEK